MDLKHKHWALIFIGFLIAILCVITAWFMLGSQKVIAPSKTASSSPETATTTALASPTAHIVVNATYYDIDLAYPSATPLVSISAAANAKAVATIRTALQGVVDQFEKNGDFGNISPADLKSMGLDQRKEALSSEFKTYTGSRTITYVIEFYEDTLGAHPNSYYRTFTFDTQTGAELQLSDLFTPGVNYLGALSNIAAAKLPQIIADRGQVKVSEVDIDYLHSGIAPEPGSFQSWYIKDKTLVIVFPPYQVGPYALGVIELPIPLSQLSSLKAEFK